MGIDDTIDDGYTDWRTYTTTDGLSGLQTEHLAQDADGFLWIGTWNSGASRFDGDAFATHKRSREGLCGNQVMALCRDREGRLWFGTLDGGVCWYDGRVFHRFAAGDGVSDGAITYIYEDREGRVWFAGIGVLGYTEGGKFVDLVPAYTAAYGSPPAAQMPLQCWGIDQDADGCLWFGLDYLVRYDGQRFARFGPEDGLPAPGNGYAVAVDGSGALWVGGIGCFGQYNKGNFDPAPVSFDGVIRKIQRDDYGRIWYCTTGAGVFYQGGKDCVDGDLRFHQLKREDGLAYPMVNGVYQDHERQTWFATWGGGICSWDPDGIRSFGDERLVGSSTMLVDGRNRLWAGNPSFGDSTQQSLNYYDCNKWHSVDSKVVSELQGCTSACETSAGGLWVSGRKGLVRFDGQDFSKGEIHTGQDHLGPSVLATDSADRVYMGHWDEEYNLLVTCYDGASSRTLYKERNSKDDIASITSILCAAGGVVWIGLGTFNGLGRGSGLRRLDGEGKVRTYTVADGLPDDNVQDLAFDQSGALWIATLGGVSRFDGERFAQFTTADGLPNDHVWSLFCDQSGLLWICTDGGVVRYDGRTFMPLSSHAIGPARCGVEDRDGILWFATLGGLVAYRPVRSVPGVRVVQIIADQVYEAAEQIEVSAAAQVMFEYKGLSFRTRPQDMLYSYRLRNWQEEWGPCTNEIRAVYSSLPPGEYLFEVKSIDRDLNESEPASTALRVVEDVREARIEALEEVLRYPQSFDSFIGQSVAMQDVMAQISTVADADIATLVLGETGVGKGLAAQAVHDMSGRREAPFIQVNCGAIPEGLVESELFGHEKGAFTGASARKIGRFELAHGGTLFLDEVGDMPLDAQRALLQVLQDGVLQRVGGEQTIQVDVRVVAATNRDLQVAIEAGRFRADLFYRLNGFVVELPPLRQRREDIPLLVHHFADRFAVHLHRPVPAISDEAMVLLQGYHWPGNVRELEHVVQRAVLVCAGERIDGPHLASSLSAAPTSVASGLDDKLIPLDQYDEQAQKREKQYLERVLKRARWRVAGKRGAAEMLGIHPEKLRARMKKHSLRQSDSG